MSISFEDAVDEILTGKKKTRTEASLAQRLKEHAEESIDIKKILHEEEKDLKKSDEQSIKKRMTDKEEEDSVDDDEEKDDEEKNASKDKDEEDKKELEKKKKREFLENLEKDDVLLTRFKGIKYKLSKDPEGDEVLRTYVRINSKNVDIKRFGSSEILQYGNLDSILGTYGYKVEDFAGQDQQQPSVDGALQAATSTPPTAPEQTTAAKSVDSFVMVIKKITEQNSGTEILCASKASADAPTTAGATVTIFGKTTSFDDRKTALDSTDLQYQQLVLQNISQAGE